jgi:pimeloyl-ACP methyl ester carboxylesterase
MEPRVLTYEIKGQGDPVVLVPGGLTGWLSWIPHAERLSARWKTVRVQPIHNELGSAGEPGDPGYTAETEREALRMTMEALEIDAAHFAGWSGGGRALIEFALEYPERVRTLTLVEPAAYWILDEMGESDHALERVNAFIHSLAGQEVSENELAEFLEIAAFVGSKDEAISHPNWERWVPHRQALSWNFERLDHPDRSVEEPTGITCPVLLIKGSTTAEWLKRVVDVLGEQLPNATVRELPGDHACHIQSIDDFLGAFEKHLVSQ